MSTQPDPAMFWTIASAVSQIAGTIATFAAVALSLWIVISERKENLRLKVGRRLIIQQGAASYAVVAFEVTNVGLTSVRVTTLGWRAGWSRWGPEPLRNRWAVQTPDPRQPGVATPFDLDPGRSVSMIIPIGAFIGDNTAAHDMFTPRSLPLFGLREPPIYGTLWTARGTRVFAKIEPALRRTFSLAQRGDPAALDNR